MPIAASVILDSVAGTLLDRTHRTWTFADLLGYLNEGLRATAFVKADMYTVQAYVPLVAGVLQELPADGIAFMDATRNEVGGRVVTQVDEGLLEEANRFWPNATQQAEVEHFTADPRNPRRFRVFPPNDGDGSIEVLYGAVPPELNYTDGSDEIPVADSYQNVLTNFVLAKAYTKNSKRQDLAKASWHTQQWAAALGLKSQSQVAVAPRVSQSPGV